MLRKLLRACQVADRNHLIGAAIVLVLGLIALAAAGSMPSDWSGAIDLRESRGKSPRVEDFARTWNWIAALSNGWILTLAGVAAVATVVKFGNLRWLCHDSPKDGSRPNSPARRSRTWLIGAFVILLIALFARWPRMDLSLYYDEGYSLLRYIDGDFKRKPGEELGGSLPDFERVTWTHTFFGNRHGNNNVLQSVLSRICNDAWRFTTGAVDGRINETALRLPSLIFGVASIGMLGRLLLSAAPVWVSWLGMLWAALHPWHVRYSTEARGYGIAFFFMLGAIGALVRAIETNRCRWWLTFLLCQVGYMYAFPGAASFALALNGTLVIWLFLRKWRGREVGFLRSRFLALVLANAGSVILFWQLMAPCLPQLKQAVTTFWSMGGGPEPGWWTDLPFYLVFGRPWLETYTDPAHSLAIVNLPTLSRWLLIDCLLGVALFAGVGCWSHRRQLPVWLLAGVLAAAPIAFAASSISDSILQKWYVVYLVSSVVGLFVLGCGWLVKEWRTPGIIIVIYAAAVIAAGSARPLRVSRSTSKEQLKDVVVEVRGGVFPFENETELPILAAVWSHSARLYDPYLRIIETADDLERLIAEAASNGRPLAVTVGEIEKGREAHPEVIDRLETSGDFELTKTFGGLEDEKFAQRLFRFNPPS